MEHNKKAAAAETGENPGPPPEDADGDGDIASRLAVVVVVVAVWAASCVVRPLEDDEVIVRGTSAAIPVRAVGGCRRRRRL